MFTSLRSRLWLTYALVIGVVLSILAMALLLYVIRNPLVDRQAIQKLDIVANLILRRMEESEDKLNIPERLPELQKVSDTYSVRILIFRGDGSLWVDTGNEKPPITWPPSNRLFPNRGVIRDQENKAWLYTLRPKPDEALIVVATPKQGGLRLLLSPQIRGVIRDEFLPPFLRAGSIALLLALILAFWVARWVATPLEQMGKAALDMADGEYRTIPPKGPDEVKALAQAFNEMSDRVKTSQQSQKDFVANVSHELKTPLTSIQGFSQAILDGTVQTSTELHQAAGIIHTESSRMYRLVVDLLDLARLDAGTANLKRETIDLERILRSVTEKLSPQALEAQVDLNLSVADLPTCVGDADRLSQVFTNLVDNAVKHTPPDGEVRIRADFWRERIRVEVADTGEGIPSQDLSRIFERFYQVDKSRKDGEKPSSGLGLAIAQQIIQAHGGEITVDSVLGEGSVFVVHLPAVLPEDKTVISRK